MYRNLDSARAREKMRNFNPCGYCVLVMLIISTVLVSGCVSSTLDSAKPETVEKTPTYDPVARAKAIAEMREKAADTSGKKTSAFQTPETSVRPLTTSEANGRIQELNSNSSSLADQLTDEELIDKQRSIEEMRIKAQTHYEDALDKIEN